VQTFGGKMYIVCPSRSKPNCSTD